MTRSGPMTDGPAPGRAALCGMEEGVGIPGGNAALLPNGAPAPSFFLPVKLDNIDTPLHSLSTDTTASNQPTALRAVAQSPRGPNTPNATDRNLARIQPMVTIAHHG